MLKDSFIVDNGANGIWVWIGRLASAKERVEAIRNAHGFIVKKSYPSHTHISRVVEGGEPTEFKALFLSWLEKDLVSNKSTNNKHTGIYYFLICFRKVICKILRIMRFHLLHVIVAIVK